MDDRLRVFQDEDGRWCWQRIAREKVVATSARPFDRQRACLVSAVHSNRKPYVLVLEGEVEDDLEMSA